MQSHYKSLLDEERCWCQCKKCPLGKQFLQDLYSWSELNPLHPWLVWKVCDPCNFDHKNPADIIEELRKQKPSTH